MARKGLFARLIDKAVEAIDRTIFRVEPKKIRPKKSVPPAPKITKPPAFVRVPGESIDDRVQRYIALTPADRTTFWPPDEDAEFWELYEVFSS